MIRIGPRALALTGGGGGGGGAAPYHQGWTGLTGVVDGSTISFTGAGYTDINARGVGTALTVNGPAGGGKVWRAMLTGAATSAGVVFEDVGAVDTASAVMLALYGPDGVNGTSSSGVAVDLAFIQSQAGDAAWDGGGVDRISWALDTARVSDGRGGGLATRAITSNPSTSAPRGQVVALYVARVGTQMVTAVGDGRGGWAQIHLDTAVTQAAGSWILRLENNNAGKVFGVDILAHMPHGVWTPSLTNFPKLDLD